MKKIVFLLIVCGFVLSIPCFSEEGMYPLSEIQRLDLKSKGLEIDPAEIYNPKGSSIIDAIVQVGGASGSFVSPNGLIITNHHVAFRAIQAASSASHDYLNNGFIANSREQEIEAKGYTVRITESYRDISQEILKVAGKYKDYAKRSRAIEKKIKEIVLKTEKANPGKRADVSAMFPGKTYILFIYTYFRDVRLVYAPPRSIGEFGGEEDNWIWPRHTGDFSFLRVYVSPDGKPADFSKSNIPFHPRRYLKVAPKGLQEGDFIFLLGYPGRTYRHLTSHYLAYEQNLRMPYIVDLYSWQMSEMEAAAKGNAELSIRFSARIKGLANTMKNYQGKLKGMRRLELVEKKKQEEKSFLDFILSNPVMAKKYGTLLKESESLYSGMSSTFHRQAILDHIPRMSILFNNALRIIEASNEREKKETERESAYMSRNFNRTKDSLKRSLKDYNEFIDQLFLKQMLVRAIKLPDNQQFLFLKKYINTNDAEQSIDQLINRLYATSKLADERFLMTWIEKSKSEVEKNDDPMIEFVRFFYPSFLELREMRRVQQGKFDSLYARLLDARKEYLKSDFIPDANSTLRFTYGRIKGYYPYDGAYYHPITTLNGVIEKTTGAPPFNTPDKLIDLFNKGDFGAYSLPKKGGMPVDILYNADTTGGNSGSAVLNARGELVGVNFDRAWEATINDYIWSPDLSRSIAVDIRYVLWVIQYFSNAESLIKELAIGG